MKTRVFLMIAGAVMLTLAAAIAMPAMAQDLHRGKLASNYSTWGQDGTQPQTDSRVPLELVIVGVVVLIVVARRVIPMLGGSRATAAAGAHGSYGPAGGAICPRCGRAFARNLLSPNMLVGKLSRCPHCGKWSIVAAASPEALAAAEAAQPGPAEEAGGSPDPQEKLRRQIEDSRYEH